MKGLFITIEGVEGSGKSTQARLLVEHLREQGVAATLTREPGGTHLAERIRALLMEQSEEAMAPLTELLLYQAARAQHVDAVILPVLTRGGVVVCDRFVDSTTAYQGAGRRLSPDAVAYLNRLATADVWPHRTFILDLPAEEGLLRARARGSDDRMMMETLDFHRRIRDAFLDLARQTPERIVIIDGMQSVEAVQETLRQGIAPLLTTLTASNDNYV